MTMGDEPMLEQMKSVSNPLTIIALFSAKKAEADGVIGNLSVSYRPGRRQGPVPDPNPISR